MRVGPGGGLAGGGPGLQHRVWVKEEATAAPGQAAGTDKLACQRKAGEGKTFTDPPGGRKPGGCPCPGEQWVLDFSGSLMRQLMERVTEASPGRTWRVDKWNYCGARAGGSKGGRGCPYCPRCPACQLQIPGLGPETWGLPQPPTTLYALCSPTLDPCQPSDGDSASLSPCF